MDGLEFPKVITKTDFAPFHSDSGVKSLEQPSGTYSSLNALNEYLEQQPNPFKASRDREEISSAMTRLDGGTPAEQSKRAFSSKSHRELTTKESDVLLKMEFSLVDGDADALRSSISSLQGNRLAFLAVSDALADDLKGFAVEEIAREFDNKTGVGQIQLVDGPSRTLVISTDGRALDTALPSQGLLTQFFFGGRISDNLALMSAETKHKFGGPNPMSALPPMSGFHWRD